MEGRPCPGSMVAGLRGSAATGNSLVDMESMPNRHFSRGSNKGTTRLEAISHTIQMPFKELSHADRNHRPEQCCSSA